MEKTANGFSRREFLKGSLASLGLGALGARRIFAVPPGWRPSGTRRLAFGVISDSHYTLSYTLNTMAEGYSDTYVMNALSYFRSRNVDAVMHCGDMAMMGIIKEMQFMADSWFSVFPDNKAPDGHEVVKLFVPGNHDVEGASYTDRAEQILGNNYQQYLLINNLAANWKSIWKEDYAEAWHKTVKGYHFFGYNSWNVSDHHDWQQELGASEQELVNLVTEAGGAGQLDGAKPFFLMSHIKPRASVNNPLAAYTNCLGFFGHIHHSCSATSQVIYFDAAFPQIQCPSLDCRGGQRMPWKLSFARSKDGLMEGRERMDSADPAVRFFQGYLVEVYDGAVVIERHDFGVGHGNAKIGPDWVMPITDERYTKANHPFSLAELKKADAELGAPQFRQDGRLGVELGDDKVRIAIPNANGNPDTRVLIYNVEVSGVEGEPSLWKSIYAAGCDHAPGCECNGGVTVLDIPREEFPAGERLTVRTYPVSPLGLEGSPLSAMLLVMDKVRVEIDKDEGVPRVAQGRYVLTNGANLPNANNLEFVLPKWVERATVEDGEIVIYVKPDPFSLRVR